MDFSIVRMLLWISAAVFIEDREQKGSVMKRTIFYRVVQLRNLKALNQALRTEHVKHFVCKIVTYSRWIELLLLNVTEIFEQLFPSLTEEPRLVATTPADVMRLYVERILEGLERNPELTNVPVSSQNPRFQSYGA